MLRQHRFEPTRIERWWARLQCWLGLHDPGEPIASCGMLSAHRCTRCGTGLWL